MDKKCFKCGRIKDINEFYKHSKMVDGHLGKCKECAKKDVSENRSKNIERIRAYDKQRAKLPHRRKLLAKIGKEYRKKYPLRYATNTILRNAVRGGKIKKPKSCSICGTETRIYGHHEDYYKPLDVIWVCQICHKKLHI